jgi:hypothetical protein
VEKNTEARDKGLTPLFYRSTQQHQRFQIGFDYIAEEKKPA